MFGIRNIFYGQATEEAQQPLLLHQEDAPNTISLKVFAYLRRALLILPGIQGIFVEPEKYTKITEPMKASISAKISEIDLPEEDYENTSEFKEFLKSQYDIDELVFTEEHLNRINQHKKIRQQISQQFPTSMNDAILCVKKSLPMFIAKYDKSITSIPIKANKSEILTEICASRPTDYIELYNIIHSEYYIIATNGELVVPEIIIQQTHIPEGIIITDQTARIASPTLTNWSNISQPSVNATDSYVDCGNSTCASNVGKILVNSTETISQYCDKHTGTPPESPKTNQQISPPQYTIEEYVNNEYGVSFESLYRAITHGKSSGNLEAVAFNTVYTNDEDFIELFWTEPSSYHVTIDILNSYKKNGEYSLYVDAINIYNKMCIMVSVLPVQLTFDEINDILTTNGLIMMSLHTKHIINPLRLLQMPYTFALSSSFYNVFYIFDIKGETIELNENCNADIDLYGDVSDTESIPDPEHTAIDRFMNYADLSFDSITNTAIKYQDSIFAGILICGAIALISKRG